MIMVITTFLNVKCSDVLSKLKTIGEMIGVQFNSVMLIVLPHMFVNHVKVSNNVMKSKSKLKKSMLSTLPLTIMLLTHMMSLIMKLIKTIWIYVMSTWMVTSSMVKCSTV